jgi:hypothetical protein
MVKITENNGLIRQSQQMKNKSVGKKDGVPKKEQIKNVSEKSPLVDSVILTSNKNEPIENLDNIEKYTGLLKKYEENQLKNLKEFSLKNESGHYNKDEIISDTSKNIVNHPGFYKASSISPQNSLQENLDRIRKNIESGKYNSDSVLNDVTEKLISTISTPLER